MKRDFFSKSKIFHVWIVLFFMQLMSSQVNAQLVSSNAFLKGNFIEVGMAPCGSFGSSVGAPAGYNPRGGGGSDGRRLGFVADPAKDGFNVGFPNYIGDYFLPGSPEEGWGLTVNGVNYNNNQVCSQTSIPGSIVNYNSTSTENSATWAGSIAGLSISAKSSVLTNAVFFTTTVTLTNTTSNTINNIFYMRNVDPDHGVATPGAGGNFVTTNCIVNQNPNSTNKALVSATVAGHFLGLGSLDARAKVTHGGFSNRNASSIWNGIGLNTSGCVTADQAISIAFNIGSLAPGEKATFSYVYVLDITQLDAGLATTLGAIKNITYDSATFSATSTENGTGYYIVVPRDATTPTATEIKNGVNYGTANVVTGGSGNMIANVETDFNISGLSAGTLYDLHFVSQNAESVFSSLLKVPFSTLAYAIPTLSTNPATLINTTLATSGGNITNDGGQQVTARGLVYSTSPSPTLSNSVLTIGDGVGSFTGILTGLNPNTTYYVRSFATNSVGTNYGNQVSFVTLSIPVIIANGPTTFCSGQSVTLTSQSTSVSYLWSNGATTRSITVLESGSFSVAVTFASGVTATSNSTNVNVIPPPVASITASGPLTFCPSESVTLTASEGFSYLWSNGATTRSIVVNTTGNFSVTVTNSSGCLSVSSLVSVIVEDVTAPIVNTQNITIQLNASGNAFITPSEVNNGSTDNCAIASIELSKLTFDCSNVGANTVILTVTDVNGNVSTANATVTVQDNIAPTVITKNITVDLVGGNVSIIPAQVNNGSFDNCSIASVVLDRTKFDCGSIGANTVTLTVTDVNNNVSTATAVVTVVGELTTSSIASVPTSTTYTGGVSTNLYLGYGAQSTTLQVSNLVSGGNGVDPRSYTYEWTGTGLSSTISGSPVFTPTAAGFYNFSVIVTNKYGCKSTASISICVKDIREKDKNGKFTGKVFICHAPPGNVGNSNTLSISVNAVPSHLSQHSFDRLGTCADAPCTSSTGLATTSVGGNSSENNVSILDLNVNSTEMIAYPNPFGKVTTVRFTLPYQEDKATLDIYDLKGTKIQTLFNGNANAQTTYEVQFNGQNLSAGTYFFRLITAKEVKNFKVIMGE